MKEHMWIDNIHRQEQRKYIFHIAQEHSQEPKEKCKFSFYSFHKGKLRFFYGNFIMFKVVIFFLEIFFIVCLWGDTIDVVSGQNKRFLFVVWLGCFICSELGDVRKLKRGWGRLRDIRSTAKIQGKIRVLHPQFVLKCTTYLDGEEFGA